MYILGLTGSIASGKSTILQMFADEGIPTISADDIVHDIYQNEAVEEVGNLFPKAIKNDLVDRKILSKILLNSKTAIKDLEKIIHPIVQKKIKQFIKISKQQNHKMIVLEIPLLFETNANYPLDAVALSVVQKEVQRKRALARENMSEEKLNMIIANQMSQEEKKLKSDFIIDSSISLEKTREKVKQIIKTCLNQNKEKNNA